MEQLMFRANRSHEKKPLSGMYSFGTLRDAIYMLLDTLGYESPEILEYLKHENGLYSERKPSLESRIVDMMEIKFGNKLRFKPLWCYSSVDDSITILCVFGGMSLWVYNIVYTDGGSRISRITSSLVGTVNSHHYITEFEIELACKSIERLIHEHES